MICRIVFQKHETAMLGWFQALMPKEERFFELFVRHATIVVAGAEALRGLLRGGEGVEHYCKQIFERRPRPTKSRVKS